MLVLWSTHNLFQIVWQGHTAMQLRCWYIVVALVTWQVSGQAPGDANPECSRDMNAVFHQFPSDWVVLMDTFDYRNIFSGNGPWESVDFDNGGSSNGVGLYNIV